MLLPAATIFLGAFLLFLVQPLMAKYILPWFGGGPGVWTTCLLFFQTLLLGGYAYAHWLTSRLRPARQAVVHAGLLALCLAWLPIMPDASWQPAGGAEPVGRILLLLTACLGLPYLALAATGPLVQRWFSLLHPGVPPYRLYALSNAGSLLALLSFPFLLEPLFSRTVLGWGWSAGLLVFAGFCGVCAWRLHALPAVAPDPSVENGSPAPAATDRVLWLVLPAVASVLLVAVTNKLCTDVAVVPFLWVLPLGLYLLSFILSFDHPRWYARGLFGALLALGIGAVAHFLPQHVAPLGPQVAAYSLMLFAACMVCHGELHHLRPAPRHLTEFYLTIAAGGALGGALVALVAPMVFADFHELPIGLVALLGLAAWTGVRQRDRALPTGLSTGAALIFFLIPALRVRPQAGWLAGFIREFTGFGQAYWLEIVASLVIVYVTLRPSTSRHAAWREYRGAAVPLLFAGLLATTFILQAKIGRDSRIFAWRDFYGTLQVQLRRPDDPGRRYRVLNHGRTSHGLQFVHSPRSTWPTTYYGTRSGVARALGLFKSPRRVGLVGLGAGTLAAYGRAGDRLRFYELNPTVVQVARRDFTYLARTPAKIEIVPGDARLSLERELREGGSQRFDVIVLDAFSSDAIPVHLLTAEAMDLYLRHLQEEGVIAVHISNRYLDLRPVLAGLARRYKLHAVTLAEEPVNSEWWIHSNTWILLARTPRTFATDDIRTRAEPRRPDTPPPAEWTDDHASLFQVLK